MRCRRRPQKGECPAEQGKQTMAHSNVGRSRGICDLFGVPAVVAGVFQTNQLVDCFTLRIAGGGRPIERQ